MRVSELGMIGNIINVIWISAGRTISHESWRNLMTEAGSGRGIGKGSSWQKYDVIILVNYLHRGSYIGRPSDLVGYQVADHTYIALYIISTHGDQCVLHIFHHFCFRIVGHRENSFLNFSGSVSGGDSSINRTFGTINTCAS